MKFRLKAVQSLVPLFLLLVYSCASNSKPSHLRVHVSGRDSVMITGINSNILQQLKRDSANTEVWQSLIPIYRMPVDTEMKDYQTAQPGRYSVNDSVVVFMPDTPFVRSQLYFIRYYQYPSVKDFGALMHSRHLNGEFSYKDYNFNY